MTNLKIEPLGSTLGATVSGIRLADLDASDWRTIESAFHEFSVLVFPNQHLTGGQQADFGRRFGKIEHLFGTLDVTPITNQRRDGRLLADDEPAMEIMRGNEGWHTDSSYMPLSAKASILAAVVVPPEGGETEWTDMRAAYDALDPAAKERVGELSAYHSIRYAQKRIGDSGPGIGYGYDVDQPPLRPLVKAHPVTGRRTLFIGRHAYGIPGLEPGVSTALLDELLEGACQPPRIHRHTWQPGDLAIWDNRCVLHRARPFDHAHPRAMRHVRISGDPASELAAA